MESMRRKILIIRNSALGDVAMTLPVVYSVARQNPDVEFVMLTRPFFARIFVNRPANLTMMAADFKTDYKGISGLRRLLLKLSGQQFTDVADLHNVLRSWVIDAWMRLHGKRVAMVDKLRLRRLSHSSRSAATRSYFDRYADVFRRLGLMVNVDFVSMFDTSGIGHRQPVVGIAPFARYYNKTYPLDMMEQVVARLSDDGIRVMLFGSRGAEADRLAQWCERYPGCELVAGKHSIEDEMQIMSQLAVMVSMDSANHHLASLAGTPVISVWGSTTPACGFMGYRQNPDDAICLNLPCQPCTTAGSPTCPKGHLNCMRQIDPSIIYNRIKTHLK